MVTRTRPRRNSNRRAWAFARPFREPSGCPHRWPHLRFRHRFRCRASRTEAPQRQCSNQRWLPKSLSSVQGMRGWSGKTIGRQKIRTVRACDPAISMSVWTRFTRPTPRRISFTPRLHGGANCSVRGRAETKSRPAKPADAVAATTDDVVLPPPHNPDTLDDL